MTWLQLSFRWKNAGAAGAMRYRWDITCIKAITLISRCMDGWLGSICVPCINLNYNILQFITGIYNTSCLPVPRYLSFRYCINLIMSSSSGTLFDHFICVITYVYVRIAIESRCMILSTVAGPGPSIISIAFFNTIKRQSCSFHEYNMSAIWLLREAVTDTFSTRTHVFLLPLTTLFILWLASSDNSL